MYEIRLLIIDSTSLLSHNPMSLERTNDISQVITELLDEISKLTENP
jgi:hypothetical protein